VSFAAGTRAPGGLWFTCGWTERPAVDPVRRRRQSSGPVAWPCLRSIARSWAART